MHGRRGFTSLPASCKDLVKCRLGVLIEVNCETDFVARGAKFKELVQDMAMQAAASPSAIVVALQDVPEAEIEKERAIEMGKEDIQSKPEAIRCVCAPSGFCCLYSEHCWHGHRHPDVAVYCTAGLVSLTLRACMGPSAVAVVPHAPGVILIGTVYMVDCFELVPAFALASVK